MMKPWRKRVVGFGVVAVMAVGFSACRAELEDETESAEQAQHADGGGHDAQGGGDADAARDARGADADADADASDASADARTDAARDARVGNVVTVVVGNGSFSPQDVTIRVGDTVHWVFTGARRHNVVSGSSTGVADNKFCSPNNVSCAQAPLSNPGATYDFTFTSAGVYPYFCTPHVDLGMVGSIKVTP